MVRPLSFALLSVFGLQLHGQTSPAMRSRPASQIQSMQPFTVEMTTKEVWQDLEGHENSHPSTQVSKQDSHGRTLFTSTDLRTGLTRTEVNDPIAGVLMAWTSTRHEVKLMQYVRPITGRSSCWKIGTDAVPARDEAQLGLSAFGCSPAGMHQIGTCMNKNEPVQESSILPTSLRIEADDEQDCEQTLAGKNAVTEPAGHIQDLGTKIIAGAPVHGCRVTGENGLISTSQEYWITKVEGEQQMHLTMAWAMTRVSSKDRQDNSQEVVRLELTEPDISSFQPPKDYMVDPVVVHEVACPGSETKPSGTP